MTKEEQSKATSQALDKNVEECRMNNEGVKANNSAVTENVQYSRRKVEPAAENASYAKKVRMEDFGETAGQQVRKWVSEYEVNASHNVFINQQLDEYYSTLVQRMERNFQNESIGAINCNFAKIYCRIAEEVYERYGKKYLPEEFNAYWKKKFSEDKRLGVQKGIAAEGVSVHAVSSKRTSTKAVRTNLYWLIGTSKTKSQPKKGIFGKISSEEPRAVYVDDFGEGIVYWNNGAIVDMDYANVYLRRYFKLSILNKLFENVKQETQKSEFTSFDINDFVFVFDEKKLDTDLELKAIKYWSGINNEKILVAFYRFANDEELSMERYSGVGILFGVGEHLYERL